MQRLFAAFLAVLLVLGPVGLTRAASAQTPPEIIGAQIDAFRAQDVERAFGYASGGIRAIFGNAETFGQMVAQGYPMVIDPAEVRYLDRFTRAGVPVQRVLIVDRAGATFLLEYRFTGAGETLRIDGVRLLPEAGTGV